MTECVEGSGDCRRELVCPVRSNWQRINVAVKNVLDAISLQDMLEPLPQSLVTLLTDEAAGTGLDPEPHVERREPCEVA